MTAGQDRVWRYEVGGWQSPMATNVPELLLRDAFQHPHCSAVTLVATDGTTIEVDRQSYLDDRWRLQL